MNPQRSEARLDESLSEITRLLEKHRVLETLTHRQEGPKRDLLEQLQQRQNLAELQMPVNTLHPADLAHVLETLPLDERLLVWQQLEHGSARRSAPRTLGRRARFADRHDRSQALVERARHLDADDLGLPRRRPPRGCVPRRVEAARRGDRAGSASIAYDENTVGALMSQEVTFIRDQQTVDDVLVHLRQPAANCRSRPISCSSSTRACAEGRVPLQALLLHATAAAGDGDHRERDPSFRTNDDARSRRRTRSSATTSCRRRWSTSRQADRPPDRRRGRRLRARSAARSAPSTRRPARGGGRLRVGVGLVENRWPWLAINLVTAFIASRVIGVFEGSIAAAGRARRADADRRQHRRQLRQPDDHDDRPRPGAGPGERPEHAAT